MPDRIRLEYDDGSPYHFYAVRQPGDLPAYDILTDDHQYQTTVLGETTVTTILFALERAYLRGRADGVNTMAERIANGL